MSVFFGTDGIRGIVNQTLTSEIAFRCGSALGAQKTSASILIGTDTRSSCDLIMLSFAAGAMNVGGNVTSVGVCPTAGVCYLTKKLGFDYGVIISASHNSAEYNGIKIVDKNGIKLTEKTEKELERLFFQNAAVTFDNVGRFKYIPELVEQYKQFLNEATKVDLSKMKVVLDCSNGAASKIAPAVFKSKGAQVICLSCDPDGVNINQNCGSTHIKNLQTAVVQNHADMGFAFDGDSDRVIAVDEKGDVIDGDGIVYALACFYHEKNKLNPPIVVGTHHTNMGVEKALNNQGIELVRTDIGDKFVNEKMLSDGLVIGGEQSGHVLVNDRLMTGDGILNALLLAEICITQNKKLSELVDFSLFKQININVQVKNKTLVMQDEKLLSVKLAEEQKLKNKGRLLVRASGTESCVRVMVECEDNCLSKGIAERLRAVISEVDERLSLCVE